MCASRVPTPASKDPRVAEQSLPTCSGRAGRTPSPADGHLGVWLRSEQPRLLHMCRHARATPRYSSASDTRVQLLAGQSADSMSPAACGAPPASTRRRSSTAGVAGRSNWWLLLLWHAAMTSADSYVHSTHAGKAAAALCVSPMCFYLKKHFSERRVLRVSRWLPASIPDEDWPVAFCDFHHLCVRRGRPRCSDQGKDYARFRAPGTWG